MSEWKTYKLGDLGILARGKSKHRPRDAAFLYGGKYPFIQTGDIKAANHKISTHTQTLSEEGLKQSKLWDKGTICITIAANIADTAILEYPACFPDSVIGFSPNKKVCDIDFMEYQLQFAKRNLQSHSIGSVQDNINLGTFLNFTVDVPDLATQTQIAQILTSLDDKIELNLQMNQTLAAMAQALFKEWFVEFNFPNFDGELENDLPKGWRMGKLGEEFNLTMGQSPKGETLNQDKEGMLFYQGRTDFSFRFPSNRIYTTEPSRIANRLDTLVCVRAPVGDINMAIEKCCIGRGLAAVMHKSNAYSYTYYSMNNIEPIFKGFESEGTVFGSLNKNNFENIEVVVPNKQMIKEFEKVVNPIDEKILNNSFQIQSLTQTRDTLLPKLMSGKIKTQA